MSLFILLVLLSLYVLEISCQTPCIPANTCFPINIGDSGTTIPGDKAQMFTCAPANTKNLQGNYVRVEKTTWTNKDTNKCEYYSSGAGKQTDTISSDGATGDDADTMLIGVTTSGSSSGAINTNYLMGNNCPVLDQSSDNCNGYMVIKRFGNDAWENSEGERLAYQDIGEFGNGTCQGYYDNGGDSGEADYFVMPVGCVEVFAGSIEYWIDNNEFGYNYWSGDNCDIELKSAQSDKFVHGKCGTFFERTHCGNNRYPGYNTICSTGGVIDTWDYWFKVICAPGGITSNGVSIASCQSMYNSNSQTNAPTTANSQTTTAEPTSVNTCPSCPGGTAKPTSAGGSGTTTTSGGSSGGTTTSGGSSGGTTTSGGSSGNTAEPTAVGGSSGTTRPTVTGATPFPTTQGNVGGSGTTKASAVRVEFIMAAIFVSIAALFM